MAGFCSYRRLTSSSSPLLQAVTNIISGMKWSSFHSTFNRIALHSWAVSASRPSLKNNKYNAAWNVKPLCVNKRQPTISIVRWKILTIIQPIFTVFKQNRSSSLKPKFKMHTCTGGLYWIVFSVLRESPSSLYWLKRWKGNKVTYQVRNTTIRGHDCPTSQLRCWTIKWNTCEETHNGLNHIATGHICSFLMYVPPN